jgi:hypothetical protein
LLIAFVISLSAISQNQTDEQLVKQTAQSWFNSFNKHDYSDLLSYTTEDCFAINPLGIYGTLTSESPAVFNKAHEVLLKNLSINADCEKTLKRSKSFLHFFITSIWRFF